MKADSKQFSHTVSSYAEIERRLKHARQLRSEVVAQGAARSAAAMRSAWRRLHGVLRGALHRNGETISDVRRFGWISAVPVVGVRGHRPIQCK